MRDFSAESLGNYHFPRVEKKGFRLVPWVAKEFHFVPPDSMICCDFFLFYTDFFQQTLCWTPCGNVDLGVFRAAAVFYHGRHFVFPFPIGRVMGIWQFCNCMGAERVPAREGGNSTACGWQGVSDTTTILITWTLQKASGLFRPINALVVALHS